MYCVNMLITEYSPWYVYVASVGGTCTKIVPAHALSFVKHTLCTIHLVIINDTHSFIDLCPVHERLSLDYYSRPLSLWQSSVTALTGPDSSCNHSSGTREYCQDHKHDKSCLYSTTMKDLESRFILGDVRTFTVLWPEHVRVQSESLRWQVD